MFSPSITLDAARAAVLLGSLALSLVAGCLTPPAPATAATPPVATVRVAAAAKAGTPELLRVVAASGFDLVRIPVTWSLHTGPGPDFVIDPAWLARVAEVVDYVR